MILQPPRPPLLAPCAFDDDHATATHHGNQHEQSAHPDMKAEIDGPTAVAEETPRTMQPPTAYRQPTPHDDAKTTKRRQSRFDPMGGDQSEDEGYDNVSHRHNFRKLNEDEPKPAFSLPGIQSLLNAPAKASHTHDQFAQHPGQGRDAGSSSSTPYHQSPSLPSLVSNSPSASPSTIRTSRYSSMASGSSMSADSHPGGWWAPEFERTPSHSSASRLPHPALGVDDNDAKRRRSDQPQSVRDQDEQARLRWMAQSRNASYPTNGPFQPVSGSASSPIMRSMQPPAPPAISAGMSRNARSHQDAPLDRRPSAVPRSLSLVSGPLANSFADLSATERERERERTGSVSDMPPPFPSPMGMDRDRRLSSLMSDNSQHEIQRMRAHTSTPPERFRAFSHPPEHDASRPGAPRAARSSLSELIMAQSGDAQGMPERGRYSFDSGDKPPHLAAGGWPVTRRSSNSSTHSNSTPGVTVNLNSDDGHTPTMRYRRDMPDDSSNPMGGMDVLAESARRVSEEQEHRRSAGHGMDDREESPRAGGPGGPKYQCAYCSKTFSRPSSLRIHTYSHTGERPFVCQEPSCGRRFSVQSNLKRHAKVHQLGQAGGASLHQLHTGPIPPRGPGPGSHPFGYYGTAPPLPPPPHGHLHNGYGYDNRYPAQPYAQPGDRPPPGMDHRYHAKEWDGMEEDELDEEDEIEA